LETLAKLSGRPGPEPFASAIADFYLTNPIARASAVMAGMSALRRTHEHKLSAAE
jgi:NADH-quinone oxidoreductase subunit G